MMKVTNIYKHEIVDTLAQFGLGFFTLFEYCTCNITLPFSIGKVFTFLNK